ncbi:spore germination protein GerPC [Paenibacillus terreus]|uniref:Spore germination protein GerPC n=2 Tax=Paenibacillus terreus TaxID=1387834 RepID=A0ABV5BDF5_9BACL
MITELDTRFRDLDDRFRRIQEELERLSASSPHITIENVHIHQPVLEKMEYRLDGLDIENLSGSLNLGNNFGAKMNPDSFAAKPNSTQKPKPQTPASGNKTNHTNHSPQQPEHSDPGLYHTSSGFKIKK